MVYKIIFYKNKRIEKDISNIPSKIVQKIMDKFGELEEQGTTHAQVKRLHNFHISDWRLRVGNYRILFNIDENKKVITIFRILHRSKLY